MSDTKFGSWSTPEVGIAIEYSLVVIEEIRQAVSEGFQRFARGGIEVGGILYGTFDGATARILAVREIACEHARGPSFVLSDKDRDALTAQVERDREDSRLAGFAPLGYYVSHTRSDITLLPGDLETYNLFFPELSQIVLVVRPGRGGSMRGGFFVREADGTVKTERSYLDFNFPDRVTLPSMGGHSNADRHPRPRSYLNDLPGAEASAPAAALDATDSAPRREFSFLGSEGSSAAPARAPEYVPAPAPQRRLLPWAVSGLAVLAVAVAAVFGLRYFDARSSAAPLALALNERDAALRIEWNHESSTIQRATSGTLEIVDGKDTQTIRLSAAELQRGNFTYMRRSGDIQVRMEVQNSYGGKTMEVSRFLGAPPLPAATDELESTRQERDALKDEVSRLQADNARQAERVRQLERTLTILRTRLGIVNPGKK